MADLSVFGCYSDLEIDLLRSRCQLGSGCCCSCSGTWILSEFQKKFGGCFGHFCCGLRGLVIPLLKLRCLVGCFGFNFDLLYYQNWLVFNCRYFLRLFGVLKVASYNYYTRRREANFDFSVLKYRFKQSNFTLDYCHLWAFYYVH